VIVDTSAIVAMLRDEPDTDRGVEAVVEAKPPRSSADTYLESCIVVDANRIRSSAAGSTTSLPPLN
jgi:ribonuclease VapC